MNPIIEQRTGRFAEIYMALWLEQLLGDDFVPLQNWVSPNRVSLFADLGKTNLDDAAGFDFVFLDTRRLLDAPLAPGEIVVPRRVHLEVKGCYGSYSGTFFMSANEIATRAAIVQEAEEAGKRIEKQGFLPGTFEPVYAVAVVEHCKSLDTRVRLQRVATAFSVRVQPVAEAGSSNQSRGPSDYDGETREGGGRGRGAFASGGTAAEPRMVPQQTAFCRDLQTTGGCARGDSSWSRANHANQSRGPSDSDGETRRGGGDSGRVASQSSSNMGRGDRQPGWGRSRWGPGAAGSRS
jgi:hypothetical protein